MREHVAGHILQDQLKNRCGYCGVEGNLDCVVTITTNNKNVTKHSSNVLHIINLIMDLLLNLQNVPMYQLNV